MRPSKPLIVRAGLSRTFGSLAGFVALALLAWESIYLLMFSRIWSTRRPRV